MARARPGPGLLLIAGLLASGCLRAPIGDDLGSEGLGSSGWTDEGDTNGLGASETTVHDASSGGTSAEPECHPSYDPCLPVVEDLDCPDVVAMGAAPVIVGGPDDYDLDADHDGVGCES
jgi:hypothetical protein